MKLVELWPQVQLPVRSWLFTMHQKILLVLKGSLFFVFKALCYWTLDYLELFRTSLCYLWFLTLEYLESFITECVFEECCHWTVVLDFRILRFIYKTECLFRNVVPHCPSTQHVFRTLLFLLPCYSYYIEALLIATRFLQITQMTLPFLKRLQMIWLRLLLSTCRLGTKFLSISRVGICLCLASLAKATYCCIHACSQGLGTPENMTRATPQNINTCL